MISIVLGVYFLKKKDYDFLFFLKKKAYVEKQIGHNWKVLRTDRGGEFTSNSFFFFLR